MTTYPNPPERTATLNSSYCITQCTIKKISAYDDFIAQFSELIRCVSDGSNTLVVRLSLLGMTSVTEEYFRRILAGLIAICPKTSLLTLRENVSVGASLYYSRDEIGFALFEHISFSDTATIKKWTRKLCELEIPETSSLADALREFEKICALRHAAIHANGRLGANNVAEIGLSPQHSLSVALDFSSFQSISEICLNTVRAYNRFIWDKTLSRWIKGKVLIGKYDSDREIFSKFVGLCCENSQSILDIEKDLHACYDVEVKGRFE
jgi:hypothetical protein